MASIVEVRRGSRYDKRDVDARELKLIRVGHYLWREAKRAANGRPVSESGHIWEALQTVWQLKKQLRSELAAERSAKWQAAKIRLHQLAA
jgi:hypothetical protein